MPNLINLRQARKAKARAAAEAKAAQNRALFGQTKAQKLKAKAEREALARTIDGARREPD